MASENRGRGESLDMQLRAEARGANGDGGAVPAAAGGHPLSGLVKLNTSKLEQKIRLRKNVSLSKNVGLAAGFDVTCRTGEVKPCGQLVFKIPAVETPQLQCFNLNVSDARVSLTSRFNLDLGPFSVKGHGRLGVNYNGRKPYVGVSVMPTRAPVLAVGATTALYKGKRLSTTPHIKLTNDVGIDVGLAVAKETDGPLELSVDDVSLTIKL